MKRTILFVMCIFIFHGIFAQTIDADSARKYIGKTKTVEGTVYNFELTRRSKTTILYLIRDFPYHALAIIITDNRVNIKAHPELFINGKTVIVKGPIFNWRGQPTIKVAEWKDVKIKNALKRYPAYVANTATYKPLAGFNGDTLAYVFANFIFNNAVYLNKALDSIITRSEIKVPWFVPITGGFNSRSGLHTDGMYLHFYTSREEDKKTKGKINPAILFVIFKNPMPEDSAYLLLRKYYTRHNDSIGFYYRKRIVDSMDYVHYHFAKAPQDTSLWPHYPIVIKKKYDTDGGLIIDEPVD
jgi:hypothetical protein